MKLPKEIFGQKVDGAYKKYLVRTKNQKPKPVEQETPITPATNIANPESYLILQGRTHGSYSYPDLIVSMEKYHHNKNWDDAHKALHAGDAYMLTIRQFVDFINLLKTGKAFNGKGKQADKATLDKILDEILAVKSPWRAEWLDAKFSDLGITYHVLDNKNIKPVTEPLEDCLMEDKTPGIDLDSWLNNATSQGLPAKKTKTGSIYYWYPIKDQVAGFWSDSNWAYLVCDWYPDFSNSVLGVRVAREK